MWLWYQFYNRKSYHGILSQFLIYTYHIRCDTFPCTFPCVVSRYRPTHKFTLRHEAYNRHSKAYNWPGARTQPIISFKAYIWHVPVANGYTILKTVTFWKLLHFWKCYTFTLFKNFKTVTSQKRLHFSSFSKRLHFSKMLHFWKTVTLLGGKKPREVVNTFIMQHYDNVGLFLEGPKMDPTLS